MITSSNAVEGLRAAKPARHCCTCTKTVDYLGIAETYVLQSQSLELKMEHHACSRQAIRVLQLQLQICCPLGTTENIDAGTVRSVHPGSSVAARMKGTCAFDL